MDPEAVGHASQIVLGKHSGRAGFADALRKMEIVLEDEEFERAFERFKELADRKGEITEEGIRAIIDYAASVNEELIHLVSMHVAGGNEVTPQASIKVETRGLTLEYEAEGDGMVHATFAALKKAFGIDARLVDYRVVPVTGGADAMAEINVVVQMGGRAYAGRSIDTDVVGGSARAFVNALNKAAQQVITETVGEAQV
jgi:2-isopropylmalate synthase